MSGTLTYENSILTEGCLTFGDYKVTYDGSKFTSEKGTCPTGRAITYTDSNGIKYYNTEWIGTNPVYYNPVTGESCTNYYEDNSKTGYNGVSPTDNQTSCLKWYAYSEQNGQVNLLLDHNTTATIAWLTKDDYDKSYDAENGAQSLGITYPSGSIVGIDSYGAHGNWNKGPLTLLKQLKSDTEGWSAELNRKDSYTSTRTGSGENTTIYTINYGGYKARLMSAVEIANITGNTTWDEKNISSEGYYFDSKTADESPTCTEGNTSRCSYGWLYDRTSNTCQIYGCSNNSDVVSSMYWTVSPRNGINASPVWAVDYNGASGKIAYRSSYGQGSGVRPVITVSKSSIFES